MKTCDEICSSISFNLDDITSCCVSGLGPSPIYCDYTKTKENINYIQKQQEMLNILNSNEIKNYKCNNCCYVKETQMPLKETKYNLIIIRHWTACNCNCVYCNVKGEGSGLFPKYNPYNIIKKLYNDNLIDKENLVVHFQGGDIGVLKEFNSLVELFEENGFKRLDFCTNNIIFQPTIQRIISKQKGTLSLSLDCGTSTTYKKIKGVDKFNQYIKNLKKYVNSVKDKNTIVVNYIIVLGINDNKKEILKFFKLMKNIGIKNVGFRLDYNYANFWTFQSVPLTDCPENLDDLILYFFKIANKNHIKLDFSCKEQNETLLKVFRTNKQLNKKTSFLKKLKENIELLFI